MEGTSHSAEHERWAERAQQRRQSGASESIVSIIETATLVATGGGLSSFQ
jgi:hypothetical protein